MDDIVEYLIDYAESMGTGTFVVLYLVFIWVKAFRKNKKKSNNLKTHEFSQVRTPKTTYLNTFFKAGMPHVNKLTKNLQSTDQPEPSNDSPPGISHKVTSSSNKEEKDSLQSIKPTSTSPVKEIVSSTHLSLDSVGTDVLSWVIGHEILSRPVSEQ
ncbi:hypothetical protein HOH45_00715 [bacterium]|nr:hypothetical protein [bacterium]